MRKYWCFVLIGTALICLWPLGRLTQVIADMVQNGMVARTDYPRYIIPYAPIALAVLSGVAWMPLMQRRFGAKACPWAISIALPVFLISELMLEKLVIVDKYEMESWQMAMCFVQREYWETMTAAEVLLGNYSPWFKLHFYLIAAVLILSSLKVLYGFSDVIRTGDRSRLPLLTALAVCTAVFLGLCVLACFTAFFRDGSLLVSPLSATLMAVFFLSLGVTVGLYAASCRQPNILCIASATGAVVLMYAGEMLLLHGRLYRFGTGWFFGGLPGIVLAPVDLCIILLAGMLTHLLTRRMQASAKV